MGDVVSTTGTGIREQVTALGDTLAIRGAGDVYELTLAGRVIKKEIKTQEAAEREFAEQLECATKRLEIRKKLVKIGVGQERLVLWDTAPIPLSVLDKFEVPTPEQLAEWSSLPKEMGTLQKICHPLLCGWTFEELLEASAPHIGKLASKFKTKRTPQEDCEQNARTGIFLAVGCDAGIAPFGKHAFLRAKTSVRRDSATSSAIRQTEQRPSKNEVRLLITSWLEGTFLDYETDRLAADESNKIMKILANRSVHYQSIDDVEFFVKVAKMFLKNGSVDLNTVMTEVEVTRKAEGKVWSKRVADLRMKKLEAVLKKAVVKNKTKDLSAAIVEAEKMIRELPKAAKKSLEKIEGREEAQAKYEALTPEQRSKSVVTDFYRMRVNTQNLLKVDGPWVPIAPIREDLKPEEKARELEKALYRSGDWIECAVQRTGRGNHTVRRMVCNSFQLSRLSLTQQLDLFDFLNLKLNPAAPNAEVQIEKLSPRKGEDKSSQYHSSKHLIPEMCHEKIQTVADLINHIATSPDFHSTPVPLSVPMDDGDEDDRVGNERYLGGGRVGMDDSSIFRDPALRVECKDQRDTLTKLFGSVLRQLTGSLTHAQRMVLMQHFGLAGVPQQSGAFIANHFGKLLTIHIVRENLLRTILDQSEVEMAMDECMTLVPRTNEQEFKSQVLARVRKLKTPGTEGVVEKALELPEAAGGHVKTADLKDISRQRVTQYLDATIKKLLDEVFNTMYVNRTDSKVALAKARSAAKLTDLESDVLDYLYGLNGSVRKGDQLYTFDELVKDLDSLTDIATKMNSTARREFLKGIVKNIKEKMIAVHH